MASATFDFVIVGAGSAGSVLANRLTADGRTSVCVIEAGGADRHPLIRIPAGFVVLNSHKQMTWPFESEASANTAGRRIRLPQGKVVGGSSSINGMVYIRGHHSDFDAWSALGNPGWSYAEVLPYFKRSERRIGVADEEYRGREGPIPITNHEWPNALSETFMDGLEGLGIRRNPDHNAREQAGSAYFQRAIERGRRVSAARAFLHPARRSGLCDLRTDALVTKLVIEAGRAVGVEYAEARDRARRHVVRARREVILCAGALNTPKLLQISGIGPGRLLQDLGLPVYLPLEGVGENLRDHYAVRMVAAVKDIATLNENAHGLRLAGQIVKWLAGQPSIIGCAAAHVCAYTSSPYADARPDLKFVFLPGSYSIGKVFYKLNRFPGMTCGFTQQRPASVGYVRAASADPFAAPMVQPNYLDDAADRQVVVAGLRIVRRFMQTPQMLPYFERETLPGPEVETDDALLDFARKYGNTSFHFVSTARMGRADDPMAVVDAQLRVRGIAGLRVADASVMPTLIAANTYAATLMIAEKAADLILGLPAA